MKSPIEKMLEEEETELLEFCSPQTTISRIAEIACGMLNQSGGRILWGIAPNRTPVGIQDAQTRANELNLLLMEKISPRPFLSVAINPVKQCEIVTIEIPKGSDKPYSLNREIWIRIKDRLFKATPADSALIVEREATKLGRWEREPMTGFSEDDCDANEIGEARKAIASSGRFGLSVPTSTGEFLSALRLFQNGQLTNAAVVLFAKNPQAWSPNLSIRISSYSSDERLSIANDIFQVGPAVRILQDTIDIIQARTGFSGVFDNRQLMRKTQPAYALFALREGLVNAIAHRDYDSTNGGITVEIYPSRLVIKNPGRLPDNWKQSDLLKKHESRPYNPDISRVLYLRELMEQLGLGAQKIVSECRKLKAKSPKWESDRGTVALTLFKAPEPTDTELKPKLNARQKQLLAFMEKSWEVFKASEYAERMNLSERQARRDLELLVNLGKIERVGSGPASEYKKRA